MWARHSPRGVSTAQTAESPSSHKGESQTQKVQIEKAKIVKVFKSPDEHPNALEATPDALWVAAG